MRHWLAFFCACSFFMACNNQEDLAPSDEEQEEIDTSGNKDTTADAEAGNSGDHEDADDYIWDSSAVIPIFLDENSITVNGSGATVAGTTVTITSAGTYSINGTLVNGQILVNTADEESVRLILNGANISNLTGAPLYIKNASKAVVILAENSENRITDGASYVFDSDDDEPNAALFSKENLSIFGNGSLTVTGNYNDGIASKDGLIIAGGNITVTSVDDGIRGKDYLIIKDGNITVNSGGDGLKSDNDEDDTKGYISVKYGVVSIFSGGDAITAETDVMVTDGIFTLTSGGGSNYSAGSTSVKGIKAGVSIILDYGDFVISSADDALHSNTNLVINGGIFQISSGDDGIHADSSVGINGGELTMGKSYEGIESAVISFNAGTFHIVASDDGINVAGGKDGSSVNGRPGQGGFSAFGNYYLYINGGYIVVDASGDGIDANGSIVMTGGTVLINGPVSSSNGALDYDNSFKITGGLLLAAGSSGMAQAPGTSSTQYSIMLKLNATQPAGTLVHLQTGNGKELFTFSPAKKYQSIVYSSPELTKGLSCDAYLGGSSTGTVIDGLYISGSYSPGSKYGSYTISGVVTRN